MEFKDREELLNDIIENIKDNLDFEVDFTEGEPLRTIIEAITEEIDTQYWQLQQIKDGSFLGTAYGDDLTELVKILGVERKAASTAKGFATFSRETVSDVDYLIPVGTLIETLPNIDGESIAYETLENAVLLAGEIEVTVEISALDSGIIGNALPNKIVVINDPPLGIESVTNKEAIIGGEEEETDENLKERVKSILDTKGNATIGALTNKISELDGIRHVSILDMERGIGTADILVLGDIFPLSEVKKEEVNKIIHETKAAGVDTNLLEPTLISLDVDAKILLDSGYYLDNVKLEVEKSIKNYIDNLAIGEKMIKNQLERFILNTSDGILDVELSSPENNITPNTREIIRTNTITIGELHE